MAQEPVVETATEWYADEMEMETVMSDEEFEFDDDDVIEAASDDDTELLAEKQSGPSGNVPVWRLIEMSRENRFLQKELADFDDYDFDNYVDDYGGEYSH